MRHGLLQRFQLAVVPAVLLSASVASAAGGALEVGGAAARDLYRALDVTPVLVDSWNSGFDSYIFGKQLDGISCHEYTALTGFGSRVEVVCWLPGAEVVADGRIALSPAASAALSDQLGAAESLVIDGAGHLRSGPVLCRLGEQPQCWLTADAGDVVPAGT